MLRPPLLQKIVISKKKYFSTLVFLACALSANIALSDVYRWYDENGRAHFSDRPTMDDRSDAVKLPIRTYDRGSDNRESYNETDSQLVMYATSWCGYCKKARKYLKANRIPYTEYDIEKDSRAKAEYDQMGSPGVPLFLVGDKHMSGFSEQAFENFYR
ncbi:MAG: glutaredoxin domain-containing protein [Gammaproteobacteria bacterium]